MNRRRFLQSLAGLALGACVGVQRVLPLAGRSDLSHLEGEPVALSSVWLVQWGSDPVEVTISKDPAKRAESERAELERVARIRGVTLTPSG